MTNPTDEELDALVGEIAKLAWSKADVAADAITALRTQLAEVSHMLALSKLTTEAVLARAERAEAALAAQIEADAGIADLCKRQNGPLSPKGRDPYVQGLSSAGQAIAAAIRAQPHDRTALDRMLAKAREKALREAIEAYPKGIGAILALIETTR